VSRETVAKAIVIGGSVHAWVAPVIGTEADAQALAGVFAGREVLAAIARFRDLVEAAEAAEAVSRV
jgi:hypothetical protein